VTDGLSPGGPEAFIRANTAIGAARLAPEVKLYLATDITPLWHASEAFLNTHNIAPPFWAFAWPGAEALAVYLAANPQLVAGKRVLDFAAGCGLAAIICAQAAAASVEAAEIDLLACAAIRLNAALNGVTIEVIEGDITGAPCRWDVILCGDVCYEAPMTRHILPWLRRCAASALVIIADPGRAYVPKGGQHELWRGLVPASLELEDKTERIVTVFSLLTETSDMPDRHVDRLVTPD